jgi:hypothetical protein
MPTVLLILIKMFLLFYQIYQLYEKERNLKKKKKLKINKYLNFFFNISRKIFFFLFFLNQLLNLFKNV